MILHIISDNTARKVRDNQGIVQDWTGDTSDPGFYWDTDERLIYVTKDGKTLLSLIPITTESSGPDAMYFYHTLFNSSDKDFQRHPDTGRIIGYRYMEPVEYIFGA